MRATFSFKYFFDKKYYMCVFGFVNKSMEYNFYDY